MLKKISLFLIIVSLLIFCITLVSCHKSPGAICNDGHRSYSTGRGTCSWHGGVDYYVDTKEIDIAKTSGLIIFLVLVGGVFINSDKKKIS